MADTSGNYMAYRDGARVAGFALEEDFRLFQGASSLLEVLESLMALEGGEPGSYDDPDTQERANEVWQDAFDAIAKAKGQPRKE